MIDNSGPPVAVIQTRREYSDVEFEGALATLRALLPREMLVLFSFHLQGMSRERANGQLVCDFNLKDGRCLSADFGRRTHWAPPPKGTP